MLFKKITLTLLVVLVSVIAKGQTLTIDSVMQRVSTGKPYVLALLKEGKPLPSDKAAVQKMQAEHLVSLFQLEKDGKISVFGPVTNEAVWLEGIIIFNDPDVNNARKLLEADPYIRDGYMTFELFNWFSIPGQRIR